MRNQFLFLAVVIAPFVGATTPAPFQDYQDYFLGGSQVGVITADVNHDGNPDLVIPGPGTLVMLGNHDGTFAAPIVAQPYGAISVAVADFDGDGILDIASTIITNGAFVNLVLGHGDGTFGAPRTLAMTCTDCYLAAADFNGDGRMDLALANTSSLVIYLGTGHGAFLQQRPVYSLNFAIAIATADLNKDGRPDLVVTDFGAQTEVVFLADRLGGFNSIGYPSGSEPFQAVLTDLNGDGYPDLVSVDRAGDAVLVRLNLRNGVFGSSTSHSAACLSTSGCVLQGLTAGDFNKDGKMDIATPGGVLYGNGNGVLQPVAGFTAGTGPGYVATGDFNHDGYADLAVANTEALNISILFGGAQPVTQPPRLSAGANPHALATGDFNRDGKMDFAVASHDNNQALIYLGNGNGAFTQAAALTATTPGAVVAKDLNGDGKLDLVVSGNSGTWIYLGNGDGTFQLKAQYGSFTGDCTPYAFSQVAASCLAAGDFNNDGIPDLVSALWIQGTVSFLLGNGDGTFRAGPQTLTGTDTPQSLVTGDFNKDGKIDVAVSNYFGTVYVFEGNGDGTFGTPLTLPVTGSTGAGLAAGDINGDGNLDLVLGGGSGSSTIGLAVWIVTGNGNGTFNTPVSLFADEAPNAVALADLNGDGLLDIAAVNYEANDVSILLNAGNNAGNLTFLPETLYGTDSSPAAIASADVNGDGKPDLLVVNQFSGDVTILVSATP